MVSYNLWRVVHRLHSASWWMLIEVKDGEPEKVPADLWKTAVCEARVEASAPLPGLLSTGCYRLRRRLMTDLESCAIEHSIRLVQEESVNPESPAQ